MTRELAEIFAEMITSGCKDEEILREAMRCFIQLERHLELIPVIASRLPDVQFTSDYWRKCGGFNPVLMAVMNCSAIEVFRALRDVGYPMFPIIDLHVYPNAEEFIEILGMNMPSSTSQIELYGLMILKVTKRSLRRSGNREEIPSGECLYGTTCCSSFYLTNQYDIPATVFDIILSRLIVYGEQHFKLNDLMTSIVFDIFLLLCLNPSLSKSLDVFLLWLKDWNRDSFSFEYVSKLIGTTIWAGNKRMYDFLSDYFSEKIETIIDGVDIRLNGKVEYGGFIDELLCSGPLRKRESVVSAIYNSLKTFPYRCCPSAELLSLLFDRIGSVSTEDFPLPLSSALISNANFTFENNADVLKLIHSRLPSDFVKKDNAGCCSLFYSIHDTETMKYIISYYPSLIWNRDNEGRNVFHYYCQSFEEDGDFLFEIFIAEFKDLCLVLPSELLYEKDNQGNYPFDYFPHSEVLKEIIRRDKYCDS